MVAEQRDGAGIFCKFEAATPVYLRKEQGKALWQAANFQIQHMRVIFLAEVPSTTNQKSAVNGPSQEVSRDLVCMARGGLRALQNLQLPSHGT